MAPIVIKELYPDIFTMWHKKSKDRKLMFIIFLECFSRPLNISIFYFYSLVVVVPSDEEVVKYGRTQASFNQVVNGVTTTNENDDIRFYNYVINNFINDLIIRWQTLVPCQCLSKLSN